MKRLTWLMIFFFLSGCSTMPPLTITKDGIDARLKALGEATPTDPEADVYNSTTGKYELTPEAHDNALNDSLRVREYEEKIIPEAQEYLSKHPPATFGMKAKWFGIGLLTGAILGAIGGIYISK